MGSIERMFDPETVALIGATEREGSVGRDIMENLLMGADEREIFPVNPNRETILGLKCYPSIKDVPKHVDLAIIAVPAKIVPKVVEECGEAGVDGVVIISAGFREVGGEGRKLEEEIDQIRRKYNLRVLGPNCFGFIRPHIKLNATFLRRMPEPGQIAFISQSGALGSAILDWAVASHIGFSMFISLGSMLDIDFGDLIDYLGEDPNTKSILIYMEGIEDIERARKFMSAARGFARTKPIIILKPGKHEAGARAARSHTGSMVGSFEVYDVAFKRVGAIRVDEITDLFNCASVLDSRYLPAGPRLAIITNAGGPGVIAADAVIDHGGEMAKLSENTLRALNALLPPHWSRGNPIDIIGDADIQRYVETLKICIGDPEIDGIIVIYTPQGAADPKELAEAIIDIATEKRKPVLAVWMGGGEAIEEARKLFSKNDIPCYGTPEEAVKTYMYMYKYKRNLELLYETPTELPIDIAPPKNHLRTLIKRALNEKREVLTEDEAERFLKVYGIPTPEGGLARSVGEAILLASRISYPVVLKIASPDITHKTDIGGIILGINNESELRDAFNKLLNNVKKNCPNARIEGVYVQKMVTKADYELIVGAKKDPVFGSVVLFGSGGVGVEVFRDYELSLPPLNQVLARRLMEETKIYKLLKHGFRNKPPVNLAKLEEILVRFSNMIVDFPEIKEVDINPLIASDNEFYAVDVRIILDLDVIDKKLPPYSHIVIRPYPTKYITPYRLKDGTQVLLRPIRPEDEPLEAELLRNLSEETKRFRFFYLIKDITHDMLVRFCNIDYDREMAIIAEYTDSSGKRRNVGVGRLIMDPTRKRGEFAIVVADDFQGKGLGTKLVDMLIEVAEEKGLESIYGLVMPENIRMIELCRKLGFDIRYTPEEVIVELNLQGKRVSELPERDILARSKKKSYLKIRPLAE
ncbi:MAG: GNAT family N-acetyltransferase [Nitrososphaerota archaeon]|nr:GNAT family N-acetyltransferase [Nitrososphaerota archaeon]